MTRITRDSKCWNALPLSEEGHIGAYQCKVNTLSEIIKECNPTISAQTGLNAGHSAVLFLEFSNTILYSFDIGRWGSTAKAHEILNEFFPKRHFYIKGDSAVTLKDFHTKVDLAFVDGSHVEEGCYMDIVNFDKIVKVGGIMIVDDLAIPDVGKAVQKFNWANYEETPISKYKHGYINGIKIFKKLKE